MSVRAAAEMRDALPELGIEARIGVTAGEVVTRTGERYGTLTDLSYFGREILPLIQNVPLSRLVEATGLSLR